MATLSASERAALPDRAFAYVDSRGTRRLPIHDAAHVRNALARFGQVAFEDDAARERARQPTAPGGPALPHRAGRLHHERAAGSRPPRASRSPCRRVRHDADDRRRGVDRSGAASSAVASAACIDDVVAVLRRAVARRRRPRGGGTRRRVLRRVRGAAGGGRRGDRHAARAGRAGVGRRRRRSASASASTAGTRRRPRELRRDRRQHDVTGVRRRPRWSDRRDRQHAGGRQGHVAGGRALHRPRRAPLEGAARGGRAVPGRQQGPRRRGSRRCGCERQLARRRRQRESGSAQ